MKKKMPYLGIATLIGALTWASFSFGLFIGFENFIEDLLYSTKPVRNDIVIVDIDSNSINSIGQWPWPRKVFADAFLKIDGRPPKGVGLDVVFSEPSRSGPTDDAALAKALAKISYPVILPVEGINLTLEKDAMPKAESLVKPLGIFTGNSKVGLGHVNLVLDSDGVVRNFPPKIVFNESGNDKQIKAFALEVAEESGEILPNFDQLKNIERIVFSSPTGSIKRVPFLRLIQESNLEMLEDKIVLIGATSPDLHDEKPTPLSRGTQMPGVEIQANIVNMLLYGYRLSPLDRNLQVLWLLAAAFAPAAIFIISRQSLKPLFANLILGLSYTVGLVILFEQGIAANVIHINSAWVLSTLSMFSYRYFSGEKEKREMRNLFSKYVSKDVLEEILKNPGKVQLGGEEKEITVFFSDIRGFTTLSEKTTPTELVRILNWYFTEMSDEILKNGGVLDKYIGDAIMAFWGAPIDDPEQADYAIKASIGMLEKLSDFNRRLKDQWNVEINIGIGLYTGPAVVGNIGSNQRFDYTIIGDTVNVASRLEGLNKEFKTRIVIGESTKNKASGKYKFLPLGQVAVKGRQEPLNIYTIEGYN